MMGSVLAGDYKVILRSHEIVSAKTVRGFLDWVRFEPVPLQE